MWSRHLLDWLRSFLAHFWDHINEINCAHYFVWIGWDAFKLRGSKLRVSHSKVIWPHNVYVRHCATRWYSACHARCVISSADNYKGTDHDANDNYSSRLSTVCRPHGTMGSGKSKCPCLELVHSAQTSKKKNKKQRNIRRTVILSRTWRGRLNFYVA